MLEPGKRAGGAGARLLLLGALTIVALAALGCTRTVYVKQPPEEVYVSDYDYLADYGEWLRIPHYGMVWRPFAVMGWRPFYHGHWSWTYDGWAWISYEPYGWLVYHYGFWDYNPHYGWVWIPGAEWSPARVEWYTFGPYCAWAPLPPPGVRWHDPWDRYDIDVWVVVDIDHFTNEDIGSHRLEKTFERDIVHREGVVKRAPTREQIERITERRIPIVQIEKRPMNVIPERSNRPPEPGRPRNAPLKKMVLPERDEEKVREYAPQVERDVLSPKKIEREKEKERQEREKAEPAKESKETDTKTKETETKKKTRTR